MAWNSNKKDVIDITLDEYYAQGELYIANFLKKIFVQSTQYGFVENEEFNYNVNKNPETNTAEINLLDSIIWTLLSSTYRDINVRGYEHSNYINYETYYVHHNNSLTWFRQEKVIPLNSADNINIKTSKISTAFNANMITSLRFLFALKSLILRVIATGLVAGSTVQYRINGLRALEKRESQGIKSDVKELKDGASQFGSWMVLDTSDDIVMFSFDTSNAINAQNEIDKVISFITGFPVSYINGENTHGMNSSGENEILAIHESLKIFYGIYIKPVLDKVEEDGVSEVTNKPSPYVEMSWANEISVVISNLSNAYGGTENIPPQILNKFTKMLMGYTGNKNEQMDVLNDMKLENKEENDNNGF